MAIQKWDAINGVINPIPGYSVAHDGKVILYATDWCGYCEQTRSLLRENNIDYFEYNIEKSVEGNQQHKRLGGKGIPVLYTNGDVVKGYNPERNLKLASKIFVK